MTHPTSSSLLTLLVAAALASVSFGASADAPAGAAPAAANAAPGSFAAQTDRLIIKYRDATPHGKGAANVPAMNAAQAAHLNRAGQQFGQIMRRCARPRPAPTWCRWRAASRSMKRARWRRT
ncbi:MAG: hypothetical protein ABIT83_13850 [Massilia sp.]